MFSYDRESFEKAYSQLKCIDEDNMVKCANAKPVIKTGNLRCRKK